MLLHGAYPRLPFVFKGSVRVQLDLLPQPSFLRDGMGDESRDETRDERGGRGQTARSLPMVETLRKKIPGSKEGEATRNVISGAIGTSPINGTATKGITPQEEKGLNAPTAQVRRMVMNGRARGALSIKSSCVFCNYLLTRTSRNHKGKEPKEPKKIFTAKGARKSKLATESTEHTERKRPVAPRKTLNPEPGT